ncbi:hypothetical protein NSK_006564 [Nannochloropsis salina CCMP1776]|jgi:hypothetical protein|uniref:Transmembrane protein n=1 Tax=Nannochloropsis salina CCMP1776 TaxID=1027361 RepID=A0A4D9CXU5_9STRA|nr:hypothetical protein NSK_006564 [Nannochloropsis salina CCMP1776]|eukprot:TFJ82235.1 hypothetical protein NSK_006564 [Nannochloropsis salina CCMP1776]
MKRTYRLSGSVTEGGGPPPSVLASPILPSSARGWFAFASSLLIKPSRALLAAVRQRLDPAPPLGRGGEDGAEGEEDVYLPREEPRDVVAHKASRMWCGLLLLAYGLLMLMSLPGSRRRFQERLRRGGGSMRALALERSKHEWDAYLRKTMATTAHR